MILCLSEDEALNLWSRVLLKSINPPSFKIQPTQFYLHIWNMFTNTDSF